MADERKMIVDDRTKVWLLENLMENIPDLIYFKDRENRFMMVSRTKAEQVGTTTQEIIGKTDFDYYPKELAEQTVGDDKHVVETGELIVGRVEKHVLPSGEERWYSTIKVPLRGENGSIIGSMGITRDITDLKRAEEERVKAEVAAAARLEAQRASTEAAAKITEAVRLTAEKYRTMVDELKKVQAKLSEESSLFQSFLDSVPALVYIKDREGRYIRASKSYQMLHPESVIGKTAFDLYPGDQAKAIAEGDRRVVETGRPTTEEGRFTAPDGSGYEALITRAPLFDKDGNVAGMVGVICRKP
jgi:PAS domain S-box-containing protein